MPKTLLTSLSCICLLHFRKTRWDRRLLDSRHLPGLMIRSDWLKTFAGNRTARRGKQLERKRSQTMYNVYARVQSGARLQIPVYISGASVCAYIYESMQTFWSPYNVYARVQSGARLHIPVYIPGFQIPRMQGFWSPMSILSRNQVPSGSRFRNSRSPRNTCI